MSRFRAYAAVMLDVNALGRRPTDSDPVQTESLVHGPAQILVTTTRLALAFRLHECSGAFEGTGTPPGAVLFTSYAYAWVTEIAEVEGQGVGQSGVWLAGPSGSGWGRVAVLHLLRVWSSDVDPTPPTSLSDVMAVLVRTAGEARIAQAPAPDRATIQRALDGQRALQGEYQTAQLGDWTPS